MSKKKKGQKSSFRNERVELASLVEEKILPSMQMADVTTLQALEAAFLASPTVATLKQADGLKAEAEALRTQIRSLAREQEDLKKSKDLMMREKELAERSGGEAAVGKHNMISSSKNWLLNRPNITDLRARVLGNFNKWLDSFVREQLASDAHFQELEAQGINATKTAEMLASKIAKAEKKIDTLEKKITRLQAEVGKKLESAKLLEGGSNG